MPAEPVKSWAILADGEIVPFVGAAPEDCRYWCREGDVKWSTGAVTEMGVSAAPTLPAKGKATQAATGKTKAKSKHATGSFFEG